MCMRFSFSPHLCQHLLSLVFFIIDILTGVRWHLIVVLICISLMIHDAEHLFLLLLTIWMSSVVKCLFIAFVHYLIWIFGVLFCYWVIRVPYIFWILTQYIRVIYYVNGLQILSIDCLFILLMVSFWMRKIFSFVTELRFRGSLLKSLIIRDKCWVKRKIALLRKLAVLGEGGLVAPVINSLKSPGIFWRLDRKKRKGPHAAEGLIFCFHRWLFPSRGSK